MENKIQLRFKLDSLEKIGFAANFPQEEFFAWLQSMQDDGIKIKDNYYDNLCKSTINNGHNLLRSKGIFNIDSKVIGPMAKIIGQYLFRLLFDAKEFPDYLHMARRQKKELEIILEFDQTKKDSQSIMNLPWELMYCPEILLGEEEDENEDGFFVSQAASIYRKYKNTDENKTDDKREVYVSVAFLTKDIENLNEVYQKFKEIAKNISQKNSNLHFEFINTPNNNNTLDLLSKEDLGRIFLSDKNIGTSTPVNKIVHLVCDIWITQSIRESGNNDYEKALFFNKTLNVTEPISFAEVFKELFNKNILQDPSLKLLVLQAWNDEWNNAYTGFEEIANRLIKKNQAAILSMPYVLNQKSADGKSQFFKTLYEGIADELSIVNVVQKLRNEIVPNFSYGFPLFYLNGSDEVLVTRGSISPVPNFNQAGRGDSDSNAIKLRMDELDKQAELLLEKKGDFEIRSIVATDAGILFQLKKDIEAIDESLKKIAAERNKFTTVSVRLENALPNKPGDQ